MPRNEIVENLRRQLKNAGHIIGVSLGSGLTAKHAAEAGADFLLALNSGRFRMMGRSSLAGYLPFADSNAMVMEFAVREIRPLVQGVPVIFGLNATDPQIDLSGYIDRIQREGFEGIVNYPSVGLVDGQYREALEECGCGYDQEVEAIRIAHAAGLFTVAFVFDAGQAAQMTQAGADVVCAHLGLTGGGVLGARKVLSLEAAKEEAMSIFAGCRSGGRQVFRMIYGGPVKTPVDARYMYNGTDIMGYIGGSSFERLPAEENIVRLTRAFKESKPLAAEAGLMAKMLDGVSKHYNYVEFVKEYVAEHYMQDVSFLDLARVAHVSRSYLSSLFHQEVGCGFPEYLVKYRVRKAAELLAREELRCSEVAELVGFRDYAQFSKMFKKYMGHSPRHYADRT